MTFAILWAVWIFGMLVAGKLLAKWLGPERSPIVWAGGTAVWPMLLLILGLNHVVARMLRLDRDDSHTPLEWRSK